MNTRFLIFFLLTSLLLFTNCEKDNDNNPTEPISGVWYLKNVSGGLAGVNINYTRDQVKWIFNHSNSKLTIENKILTTGPEDIYAGLDSGVYTYEIREDGQIKTLYIKDNKRGVILLSGKNLELDDNVAADGLSTKFER